MSLFGMLPGLLNMRQPSFLVIFVTARCNARCSFCFYGSEVSDPRPGEEMTLDEYDILSRKSGTVPYLLLSGGEPVLRDDLEDIIGLFVENAGSRFVTVPSNGLCPDRTGELFRNLTSKYPGTHFRASLSLDHPDERHDESRGVDGCLESIVRTSERIVRLRDDTPNLSLDTVTVYMGQSEEELAEIREFVRTRIRPNNHELHLLRPQEPGVVQEGLDIELFLRELDHFGKRARTKETRALSPLFRGINNTFLSSMSRLCRGKWIGPCMAGRKFSVISERGKVRLCELRSDVLGDLRENDYDLLGILGSRKAGSIIRDMNKEKCTCTWECAMSANILYNPVFYPGILCRTAKELFSRRAPQ